MFKAFPFLFFLLVFCCPGKCLPIQEMSAQKRFPSGIDADSLETVLYRYQLVNPEKAIETCRFFFDEAKRNNNTSLFLWTLNHAVGAYYYLNELPDSIKEDTERYLKHYEAGGISHNLATLYHITGKINLIEENYDRAFKYCLLARDMFARIHDSLNMTMADISACAALGALGEQVGTLEAYLKADTYFQKHPNFYKHLLLKFNIASSMAVSGVDVDSVIGFLDLNEKEITRKGDSAFLFWNKMMKGSVYLTNNMLDSAERYYMQAAGWTHVLDNPLLDALLQHNIGIVNLRRGMPEKALPYLKETERRYLERKNCDLHLMVVYRSLSQCMTLLNRYKDAYDYLQKSYSIKTGSFGSSKLAELQRISMRHILEEKDQQMELQSKKDEVIRFRFMFWLIVIISMALVLLLVIVILLHRNKIIQKEQANNQKIYHLEIDSKNRELASSFLLLANKNNILSKIKALAEEKGCADGNASLKQIFSLVDNNLKNDDEWKHFQIHFNEVHPDFFNRLRQRFPGLTENDIRLCAYIKIGLRNKEIASLNHISSESVKMNRYRLKQRMNLGADENLDAFISSL